MASSKAFGSLGHYTWQLTYKWARFSHPNKGARWVTGRYYGKFCPSRDDKWVFGDRDTGAYLLRHNWTGIRRRKHGPALGTGTLTLLTRQENKCPHCGNPFFDLSHLPSSPEDWEHWWLSVTRQRVPRAASTEGAAQPTEGNGTSLVLMHASCHRSARAAEHRITA